MSQEQNPLVSRDSSPNIDPDVAKKLQNDPAVSAFGVGKQGKLHVWLHPPTQASSEQELKKLFCSRLGWVDPPHAVVLHFGSWVSNPEITPQQELTKEERDRARRKYIRSLRGKYTSD
jgi:hypothetical protein